MMRRQMWPLGEVLQLTPTRHGDDRGFFCEIYNAERFAALGITDSFVQDNQSLSARKATVRGLHFQIPPAAQAKLVRVVRGAVLDVAVDIRRGSPSFGKHVTAVLSATTGNQLYIPAGFAHGFCTLEPATEIAYKVSVPYSREHDRGLLWDDPDLGIAWPVRADEAVLSDRDREHPGLADLPACFEYGSQAGPATLSGPVV